MSDTSSNLTQGSSDTGPNSSQSAPAVATPSAPSAPTIPAQSTQAPATGVPSEDRLNWVPPHRIRESREAGYRQAQQEAAQQQAQLRQEAEQYRAQLHRLVGVGPQADPQVDAVRQQFAQLYPSLAAMEARGKDLMGLLDRAPDFDAVQQHHWGSYARQTMDRLYNLAAESSGTPLNDEGKQWLHSSFVGWINASPGRAQRYEQDPGIVENFWKEFTSNFADPLRRSAAATVQGRAAQIQGLPQDTPGGAPRATPAPTGQSLDDRVLAGWNQYQQTNRGR